MVAVQGVIGSSHAEDSPPRPFVATSENLANIARAQGLRLPDEQTAKKMHEQWKANWDDVDDQMESPQPDTSRLGDAAKVQDRNSGINWWLSSASSSSSSSSSNADERSAMRAGRQRLRAANRKISKNTSAQYDPPSTLAQHLEAAASSHHKGQHIDEAYPRRMSPNIIKSGANMDIGQRLDTNDDTLALLLPLLVLLSTLLFLLLIFIILVIFVRRRARIALTEGDGPLDIGREEELEGLGGLQGVEERWLETVDDAVRRGYARAKDWTLSFPPGSQSTDITLSQFLTIQEKGVSAWSFDPDYESNPSVFVEARTEITFIADGEGMAPQEGGGCCVQSNLPLPKINEVYYWEAKMFTKPDSTNVAIGLASKPYPSFRLPGFSKFSVGFFSADGFKAHNYPFTSQSYGPAFLQGDVIGVGYRPRSGTVFFTRNGKKLEDAFVGLYRHNMFPTVGADGAAEIHINLGQAGFVFIEANVKKWGLAPMVGTLAPPPAYGMERGSILIETGQGTSNEQEAEGRGPVRTSIRSSTPPPPPTPPSDRSTVRPSASSTTSSLSTRRRAKRSARAGGALHSDDTSQQPSSAFGNTLSVLEERGHTSSSNSSQRRQRESSPSSRSSSYSSADAPHNPPTPNHLDISLHSLDLPGGEVDSPMTSPSLARRGGRGGVASYFPPVITPRNRQARSPSPPPYLDQRHSWSTASGALGGTDASNNQARRASGRSHTLANALFGALAERGLLTPLSSQGAVSDDTSSRAPLLPRHESTSVLEYERLQQANTQANGGTPASNNTWFANWFRT
jgi:hypothetical protein